MLQGDQCPEPAAVQNFLISGDTWGPSYYSEPSLSPCLVNSPLSLLCFPIDRKLSAFDELHTQFCVTRILQLSGPLLFFLQQPAAIAALAFPFSARIWYIPVRVHGWGNQPSTESIAPRFCFKVSLRELYAVLNAMFSHAKSLQSNQDYREGMVSDFGPLCVYIWSALKVPKLQGVIWCSPAFLRMLRPTAFAATSAFARVSVGPLGVALRWPRHPSINTIDRGVCLSRARRHVRRR